MKLNELTISHSSRMLFRSCARKFEFRKFYPSSDRDENIHTLSGHGLHKGYQSFLVDGDKDRAILNMMLEIKTAYDVEPLKPKSLEACYATLLAMMDFDGYNRYELAYFIVDGVKRPAIEVPFQINIKDFYLDNDKKIPIKYIGYIDVVFYDRWTGEFIVVDIKSTSRELSELLPLYKFDEQCLPYSMVLESVAGKQLDTLSVNYMHTFVSLDKPWVKNLEFKKSRDQIMDWSRGLYMDLQLMRSYYEASWFPRNSNTCTAWNRTCNRFEICHKRDDASIELWLKLSNKQSEEEKVFTPWIEVDLDIAA